MSNIDNRNKILYKKRQLNELIYDLYGLTNTQKTLIKEFFEEKA
jgi:hypothetical protein